MPLYATHPIPCRLRRDAFTLIELLIVIGIIAVLAAILIPAADGLRKRAHIAGCANNLRSIYAGITGYMAENDGTYPPVYDKEINSSGNWASRGWLPQILEVYIDSPSAWNCPAQPRDRDLGYGNNPWRAGKSWYIPSYSINSVIAGKTQDAVFSSLHPQRQILITEGRSNFWDAGSISPSSTYMEAPHEGVDTNVFLFANGLISSGAKKDVVVYTAGGGSTYRIIAPGPRP